MPVRIKTSTTRLPQSLRQEIDDSVAQDQPRRKWPSRSQISRKEARKQERVVRKKNKAEFFSANPTHNKRSAETDHVKSPKRKKLKHNNTPTFAGSRNVSHVPLSVQPAGKATSIHSTAAPISTLQKKTSTALEKLAGGSNTKRVVNVRSRKEEEEDSYIAYLESKLGYNRGSTKKKVAEDDGLDDLLVLATSLANAGKQASEGIGDEGPGSDDFGSMGGLDSEDGSFDEWYGIEELPEYEDTPHSQQTLPVDKSIGGTQCIPPHLRAAQRESDKSSEISTKLTRQLKGLLNRMSEQNMATILDSVEEIYRNHIRNDVTYTLTTLVIDGIASHSSLLDSYVVLYAAFISSLHKIVGVEFAAYFIQNVVSSYEQYTTTLHSVRASGQVTDVQMQHEGETQGKECSNLIVLLSELYNFQVISSVLVFDVIRGLLDGSLTEFNVELLLKIVRNSGQQLRQDDPSALKDIIQIVQTKVSQADDALNSRTRFMIETLSNLKNNKLKRNTTQNQGSEAVERMKKFLAGLTKKRHVLAHEPLRISLADLHSAEIKGKWWLVGAAWGGDPLVDRQEDKTNTTFGGTSATAENLSDNNLIMLARKQGMNTDIRRSIFVVLMSSDDYVDACERLSQLNLTEVQQREIIRVLLHCCGNEVSYNPYYTLVCQHLCRTSHSYKVTLQFCLWDFFRDLGETTVGGTEVIKNLKDDGLDEKHIPHTRMRNIARAYAWWVAKDCVTLAILKPVDFTVLKPQTREFLREFLIHIFISSQVVTPMIRSDLKNVPIARNRAGIEEVFIKATRIETLAMGLLYFMTEAFRDLSGEEEGTAKLIKWANELGKDTLRTGVDVVPNL